MGIYYLKKLKIQSKFYNFIFNLLVLLSFFTFFHHAALAAKKRIVFFYIGSAPHGKLVHNGHTAACEAAKKQAEEEILRRHENINDYEIDIKNINDFSKSSIEELVKSEESYINLIKTDPEKYTKYYDASKLTRTKLDPLLLETNFDLKKLSEYLDGDNGTSPVDVAVGAHWLVPLAIAQIKAVGKSKKVKTGWMFTDYYENPLFPEISKCIDMTFLGAQELVEMYKNKGVDPSTIVSSGIPINLHAESFLNKNEFLKSKNLIMDPDVITITLAGGGEGLGNFPVIVNSIREKFKNTKKTIQLIAVTAKNEEHFKKLNEMKIKFESENNNNFHLKIEKTIPNEDMLNYVKSSDLYIVKSGGLSPTEGAVIGTPMILLDVLGGHERDNAEFYQKVGIGLVNKIPETIGDQAFTLLNDENRKSKMVYNQKKFKNERDFSQVAKFLLDYKKTINKKCWDDKRSKEREKLLKEIGLGSRDEMIFLKKGWDQLSLIETKGSKIKNDSILAKAESFFKKALLINPDNYAANYMMAHVKHLQGNLQEAINYINQSIQFDLSGGVEGQFFHRGIYHLDKENVTHGIDDLMKALSIYDKMPEKKDKNFKVKVREVLIKKMEDVLEMGQWKDINAIFIALLKSQSNDQLGSYFPCQIFDPLLKEKDSACGSKENNFNNLEKSKQEAEHLLRYLRKFDDSTLSSITPPLSDLREKLYKIVSKWTKKLDFEKDPLLLSAVHYRDALNPEHYNEKNVYHNYYNLIREMYSEKDGNSFLSSIRKYTESLNQGSSKDQAKNYYTMALEYYKKIPENSSLKLKADLYVNQTKEYLNIVKSEDKTKIHMAYQELLKVYDDLLNQAEKVFAWLGFFVYGWV